MIIRTTRKLVKQRKLMISFETIAVLPYEKLSHVSPRGGAINPKTDSDSALEACPTNTPNESTRC